MKVQNLTFDEKEALKEKSRKKVQALINQGFNIVSNDLSSLETISNKIANDLEANESFTLTIPQNTCICLKASGMVLKLLKPYIKDWLHVEQKTTKTNYILFAFDEDIINQLQDLKEQNEHLQLVDTFELTFNKYTLPTYTNTARLYSVVSAPILTKKEVKKILELHRNIQENKDNYFLLSNNVTHSYNMPMTILRLLGENVVSLKALNILELILIFATNSTAIYRQTNDDIKPFAIPLEFFSIDDFNLNQTKNEIINSLKELQSIGLINKFKVLDEVFIIDSNIISKSIKQYSYKQCLHYYKGLDLHQREYVYTFLNYLRYVRNIEHTETIKDLTGNELKKKVKSEKLTITLEGLIYNLELEDYMHDLTRIATILDVLQQVGIQEGLLNMPVNQTPITKETVKYLLANRDKIHEYFTLNQNDITKEEKNTTTYLGRKLIRR